MFIKTTLLLTAALLWATALGGPMPLEQRDTCTECANNCDITARCSSFLNAATGKNKKYCGWYAQRPSPKLICDLLYPLSTIGPAPANKESDLASRPGYKASAIADNDTTHQWRLNFPGHEHRVWVTPGVVCDQLCANPFGTTPCSEVPFVDQCKP